MQRPNRTTLERIDDEVERGIQKILPRLLRAMELQRHTQRGRRECDCEYCQAKARGTVEVGLAATRISWNTLPASMRGRYDERDRQVRTFGTCGVRYHDEWLLKEMARDRVRKEVRDELQAIKDDA